MAGGAPIFMGGAGLAGRIASNASGPVHATLARGRHSPAPGYSPLAAAPMTSLIFLLMACAIWLAWAGNRRAGGLVFALAALLSVVWLSHHMTDPLQLAF